MKAIGKYIVIETIEEQIKTKSGLLLSSEDMTELRYGKAKVIHAGTEVEKVNDKDMIYYDKRTSHTMIIENEPFSIIQERDVVVVL
tara:strand:- start:7706 stop:7963 length:258 start_codon:yes stop_codon:yes gene_type:complete